MNLAALRDRLLLQEDLNFLLTNRVPRIALTRFMGWFSKIRNPWVCRASIAVWRLFTELDLRDAKLQHFDSLHACFTRELKPGARTVDPRPDVLASPCDGFVGAHGTVQAGTVLQAKGSPYRLAELLGSTACAAAFEGGSYVTLRLTSAMYHRFHAPCDGRIRHVSYIAGDTWNVNPIALQRVKALFCRNERACKVQQHIQEPCAGPAPRRCPATTPSQRGRSWGGSSTAPPSSSSHRRACSWPRAWAAARACAWGRRC